MKRIIRNAFTLAEVLIVLGIIGMISDMTIPTLMNNVQNKELKVAWKKEYSSLKQAESMMIANGDDITSAVSNSDGTFDANSFRDGYLKYLNFSKKCDINQNVTQGCWYPTIYFYAGAMWTPTAGGTTLSGAILNDGTLLLFNSQFKSIVIDVNGFKKPNKGGIDVFTTNFGADLNKGQLSYGSGHTTFECAGTTITDGRDCSTYYLFN